MTITIEIELGFDGIETLSDVISALKQSRDSLVDGSEPLSVGDQDVIFAKDWNRAGFMSV